ncbi:MULTISPECIES: ketopantoate reductase family protein [Bradyrhizobium]|jgi:2-dehydropantoate 2-reductase|uniref:2-dehydropantoate 2-reductase n=1 Tax=Bradyrhizobium japonicum TaxID=375 RepID=A0A1Y2JTG4_BRAJP|nr:MULTISPECIES: 2-dehydropantoate 2-reductase [Bradyrhizobium]OSJ34997.1 2-dehydropantoate 2-reductase [Bradyrhizobium japonicum]TFW53566.1 2-dehydropantoate 2-reductase [Bradyrhizobium sp. MOS001]
MQIAIVGAGAVGCFYGGLLARAGHDVLFIGRRVHVDAINSRGLLLDTQNFKGYLPASAATDASSLASPDVVLVCVKSADTEEAGRSLAGRLDQETSILSLQNGVDNPRRFRAVTGHPVIPAVVYVGSEMAGPGHVKHHGGGALVIGSSPRSEALAQMLRAADIQTTVTDDIEKILWSKLVTNCAYNALSAVAGISYGPMLDVDGTRDVVASAVQEAITIARACGVLVQEDLLEQILKIPAAMPNQMSSTAQDLARGKPSEIDFLNGYVVRKGIELGIPTPTNRALQVMVKLAEAKRKQ